MLNGIELPLYRPVENSQFCFSFTNVLCLMQAMHLTSAHSSKVTTQFSMLSEPVIKLCFGVRVFQTIPDWN